MGKRGPKPTPTALKLARGTHRPSRDGDPAREPTAPPAEIGNPPSVLGAAGKATWRKYGPLLLSSKLLTQLDMAPFLRYCLAHDHVERLNKILEEQGEYFETEQGYVGQHPAVNQRFKWIAEINRFEARFGMTASDRCGMQVNNDAKPKVASRSRA